jgi:hypothetical protein
MSDSTSPIGGRVSNCDYSSIGVAAATTIYKGTLICANAAGEAVDAENLQEFSLLGVARDTVVNAGDANAYAVEYWTSGQFDFTIAATADATYLGLPVYVSDNQTVTLTPTAYLGAVGIIRKINSSTSVRVELMPGLMAAQGGRGETTLKFALTAEASPAAAGCLSVRNTSGVARIITNFFVDVTTQSTGAASIDAGIAATAISNDTLIDGASVATVALLDFTENQGTNGADARKWVDDDYLTITASADTTGLVGSAYVTFINA